MHIAICDDESEEVQHLNTLVKEFDSTICTSTFSSSEALLAATEKQRYDLVLLDIEMNGMDGFTAATKIVKMPNPPLIVLVTNSGEYTLRGYAVAFRYLPKPVSFAELASVLTDAMEKIAPQKLSLPLDGCSKLVPICDIICIESFRHYLKVCVPKDAYECRMKLCDVEALLPKNRFASPHKGYLVNLDYISEVGKR